MKNNMRIALLLVVAVTGACASVPQTQQGGDDFGPGATLDLSFPEDEYIEALLQEVVPDGCPCGMLVGVVDPDGSQRLIAYGSAGLDRAPLEAESVLEIGSLTKVFTGVLLAEMARRGEVDIMEPLARLVPSNVRIPSRSGKEITLLDLATHTSGLPVMPANFPDGNAVTAYAQYTSAQIYDFVAVYELPRDPGQVYEYSNLLSLLGHVLASHSGMDYEVLLRERVLNPLDMQDTGIIVTPEMERRLTDGHSGSGNPAPYFVAPAFEPSGGLKSTMADMLRFAAANLTDAETLVHGALRDARRPYRPVTGSDEFVGLAWGVNDRGTMAGHSGGTFGFGSYINIDTDAQRAIVVLANFAGRRANLVGVHLIDPQNNPRPQ